MFKNFLCVVVCICSAVFAVHAQTPQLINYQGKLDSSGVPVNGTRSMVFTVYDTSGTSLWTETNPTVTVSNGVFSVLLGSVTTLYDTVFTNAAPRFLGVKVGSGAEMTPRFRFASVAYAVQAANVRGLTIDASGEVGIGITNPNYLLHVVQPISSRIALWSENTYVGNADGTGLLGRSVNNPFYGFGVQGQGGYMGVYGFGNGTTNASSTFGVYGVSTGSASPAVGTRYGVYGTASGGATNYGVYCSGNGAYTGTWLQVSDQKFKSDLSSITNALGLVNQLNPISYQLRVAEYPTMNFPTRRQYGFVAQELEKTIPLLVEKGVHPGANKGEPDIEFESVNYIGMIPILTKAIQEQQQEIQELKALVKSLTDGRK